MDNVDAAIDSLARVDDDSKSRVTEKTEGRSEDRGDIATSGRPFEIGLTGVKRLLFAPGTITNHVTTDLISLREDVDWLLTFVGAFFAILFLLILFRR